MLHLSLYLHAAIGELLRVLCVRCRIDCCRVLLGSVIVALRLGLGHLLQHIRCGLGDLQIGRLGIVTTHPGGIVVRLAVLHGGW